MGFIKLPRTLWGYIANYETRQYFENLEAEVDKSETTQAQVLLCCCAYSLGLLCLYLPGAPPAAVPLRTRTACNCSQ